MPLKIEDGIKLDYDDVLIKPKRSKLNSRNEVNLVRDFVFPSGTNKWSGIPIAAANMDGVGTLNMAFELSKYKMLTVLTKSISCQDILDYNRKLDMTYIVPSMGIDTDSMDNMDKIIKNMHVRMICIDVANGYSEKFDDTCKLMREKYPEQIIIAGNVATPEMTEQLIMSGIDAVKIGIGPGSVCSTRLKTGIGYPQLSAVAECADAAHGLNGHIMADGGCKNSGDVAKAFAGGADFVMIGGMFAGTDEGDGKIIDDDVTGEQIVIFYGMSSKEAQEKHGSEMKEYRASEGRCVTVSYKGPVKHVVQDVLGGLRSACTYTGAIKLKHLPKCASFVRVNNTHNRIFTDN